jgi:carbon starvation protein CstA
MVTFLIGLAILIGGAAVYGRFCEKVFGPDERETPCYTKQDGIDYVPMKRWKNSLINLLNIAGTGPIIGPIQGILFGPLAFLTIPIGNIIGGAMHDYFCGMICTRDGGTQMPEMIKKYTGKKDFLDLSGVCVRAAAAGRRSVHLHPRRHCRHAGLRI